MRQIEQLFGKLNAAEQRQHAERYQGAKRAGRKLEQASATLARTAEKLDHLAGDFDARGTDAATTRAA